MLPALRRATAARMLLAGTKAPIDDLVRPLHNLLGKLPPPRFTYDDGPALGPKDITR